MSYEVSNTHTKEFSTRSLFQALGLVKNSLKEIKWEQGMPANCLEQLRSWSQCYYKNVILALKHHLLPKDIPSFYEQCTLECKSGHPFKMFCFSSPSSLSWKWVNCWAKKSNKTINEGNLSSSSLSLPKSHFYLVLLLTVLSTVLKMQIGIGSTNN